MKFLTRINRNYLILFTLILAVVTITGYFILRFIIVNGTKENLLTREYFIEEQIKNTGEIPNLHPLVDVQKTTDSSVVKSSFSEVTIWNEPEKEDEIFIEFSDKIKLNDSYYFLKLRQSAFENEDLVLILLLILFILLSAAFIVSFLITRKMNKTVWADFEYNLQEIENFSLSMDRDISLLGSETEEFERLNRVINDLTKKIKSDYHILKEFTENASHEIQTPLSVALLNLEEILQHITDEDNFKKVAATISALKRLSTLNQSLILLSRIESKQFTDDKIISFKEIVNRKTEEFSLLFESKSLHLKIMMEGDLVIRMNEQLAEILINNLLSNAVNHNIIGGTISIFLGERSLKICNTGKGNILTDENIFNRFVRGDPKSFGLGLAIAKKICETFDLRIHYFKDDQHCFLLKLKS
jgi:signal transduction histidine kinase